jgi:hypothetical protein
MKDIADDLYTRAYTSLDMISKRLRNTTTLSAYIVARIPNQVNCTAATLAPYD